MQPAMLPPNYRIRLVAPSDYEAIIEICKLVYPTEEPYTAEELEDHRQVFPQGQFVAIEESRNAVAGVHFTLRLRMMDFHIDDPWDILTAGGSFLDHNPEGHDALRRRHHGASRPSTPWHRPRADGSGALSGAGRKTVASGRRQPIARLLANTARRWASRTTSLRF